MEALTPLQRRILAVLEEAAEEEFCTLMNTVARPQGTTKEIDAMRKALSSLLRYGLIELARSREPKYLGWLPLSSVEASAVLQDLAKYVQWPAMDRFWKWRNEESSNLQILLTDSGMKEARNVLTNDGWPGEPLDRYE